MNWNAKTTFNPEFRRTFKELLNILSFSAIKAFHYRTGTIQKVQQLVMVFAY